MNIIRTGFVNTKGLNVIKQWVESTTAIDDAGPLHSTDARNLDAWASDVERHLNDMQNGAWCEMLWHSTRSGRTETLVLSDDCIDWSEQSTD
jgi:hypothetical protein